MYRLGNFLFFNFLKVLRQQSVLQIVKQLVLNTAIHAVIIVALDIIH
jgi:hypothetical protein